MARHGQTATGLRLRPPRHGVAPRARRWWTAQAWLTVTGPLLLTAAALLVLSLLFFPGALPWLGPLLLGVLVLPAVVYVLAMPRLRCRIHAWEVGESAVYAAGGWLLHKRRIAPLSRVQTVDTVRGPLQRAFGLATVTVTTASTAGDVRITGVSDEDAERIASRIAEAARLTPREGDAA
ncbi:PH domain-containing protein [Streptomyces sp. NRRL B-1677]|uniref:PH domain-containing protein n=1 Tax=Streptomyces klenkii TaxID=1420899 RepID=A0A3B0ARQ6_9ACTN|nr:MULTISPECIES: PH domain-containing protein [Streptomyces]MBF6049331.1 PH domain-containing protein [Streptomyces sp. NRRL B-1677]RKN62027.1 PH domain-containing protein [Streptomyces klenkii]